MYIVYNQYLIVIYLPSKMMRNHIQVFSHRSNNYRRINLCNPLSFLEPMARIERATLSLQVLFSLVY